MRAAAVTDAWTRTAMQLAQEANLNRDPTKGRRRRPSDYFRFPRHMRVRSRGVDFDAMRKAWASPMKE